MNAVETVIVHWRRPLNIEPIIDAVRKQTMPSTITLIDSHEGEQFELSQEVLDKCDRIYRWTRNHGSFNRFVACGAYDHEYTLFIDDDVLPGDTLVEHFVRCAGLKRNQFAALGVCGRRLEDKKFYARKDVLRASHFVPVDVLVRVYFVRTEFIHFIPVERLRMKLEIPILEDDILMCHSLKTHTNFEVLLTPMLPCDPFAQCEWDTLVQNDAIWCRPDTAARRQTMVVKCLEHGWAPV
jgi:hypothetical protein